eukprot:6048134-Amphidinium_carterae.1
MTLAAKSTSPDFDAGQLELQRNGKQCHDTVQGVPRKQAYVAGKAWELVQAAGDFDTGLQGGSWGNGVSCFARELTSRDVRSVIAVVVFEGHTPKSVASVQNRNGLV